MSKWGYSPDCHVYLHAVFWLDVTCFGCCRLFVKKRGVTGTPGPPGYALETPAQANQTKRKHQRWGKPWNLNKWFENQYDCFTMFVGSSTSELLPIVLLSQPLAVTGHWLVCTLTLFCAGHSLTDSCDALFGEGEACWTGHPLVGVSVRTAAPELPPLATGLDTEPPISKKQKRQ